MKRFLAVVLLTLTFSGCANYVMHPGAVSVFESKTYDAVNDANSLINYARPKLASGELPASLKPAFNKLVEAYNVAFPALKAYDDAVKAGQPSDLLLNKLTAARTTLLAALAAFRGAK